MNSTGHFEIPDKQDDNVLTNNKLEKQENGSYEDVSPSFEINNTSSIVRVSMKRRHSEDSDPAKEHAKQFKIDTTDTFLKTTIDVNILEAVPKITTDDVNNPEPLPQIATCVKNSEILPKTATNVNDLETLPNTTNNVKNQESIHDDITDNADEQIKSSINVQSKEVNSVLESVSVDSDETSCEQPSASPENESAAPPPIRTEAKHMPKLYRLLGEGENIAEGLTAKNPNAGCLVAVHVAKGSKGGRSQFISTCASLYAAENLRRLKIGSSFKWGEKGIAEIDVASLPENVRIIDLRSQTSRRQHECADSEVNASFHKFAASHQEVLLLGRIPPSCLTLIPFTGTVPFDSESDSCSDDNSYGNSDADDYSYGNSDSDDDW